MEIKEIINLPIPELGLDSAFNENCDRMGFHTLKEILIITPAQLVATEGFTYHWLGELVKYLSERGWLHYLQPIAGREKEDISAY